MRKEIHVVMFLLLVGGMMVSAPTHAQVPTAIPIQGYLTDKKTDEPIEGHVEITLKLYADSDPDKNILFEETQPVSLEAGTFTVLLGSIEELDLNLFAQHPDIVVGITINDDFEMSPLLSLGTVPYAAYAAHVDPARYQTRIAEACGSTGAISKINVDGSIECTRVPSFWITERVYEDTNTTDMVPVNMTSTDNSFCFLTYIKSDEINSMQDGSTTCQIYATYGVGEPVAPTGPSEQRG